MKKILALVFGLFLVGCTSKAPEHPNLAVEDFRVPYFLTLQDINKRFTNGGLMEMEARFKNDSFTDKEVVYKVDWFDQNGFLIKNITTKWKRARVQAKRDFIVHAISPNDKAVDFKLRVTMPGKEDKRNKNIVNYEYQK